MTKTKTTQAKYRPGTDRNAGKWIVEWQTPMMDAPAFSVVDTEPEAQEQVDRLMGITTLPAPTNPNPYSCPKCGGAVWRRVESDIDPDTGRPLRSVTTYECEGGYCGTIGAKQMAAHVRRVRKQAKSPAKE